MKILRLAKKLFELNRRAYVSYKERREFLRKPPDYWSRFPQLVLQEHAPVFFVSTGRCGTALVTKILEEIPGVACFHAPAPELLYSERKAYEEGLEKPEAYQIAVRAARFELVAECEIRGRTYVETSFRCTFFAPHLYELFPRSRFVHLVRHPGAFVRSGVRRRYYEGQYTDIGRIIPLRGPAAERWAEMTTFERNAWLWNETNEFIELFKEGRDRERILTVKAEDLFSDPDMALKIIEHCGLPAPPRKRIARWIRRPINAQLDDSNLPPYEDWDGTLKQEVRRWVTCAERYGYEL